MYSQLVVIHRLRSAEHSTELRSSDQHLLWQTCLREIMITWSEAPAVDVEMAQIYSGEQAYQFLLEVICGLHSPIKGETEVQGQFRQLREKIEYPKTPWGKFMRQVFNGLARDSKVVRTKHLKGLGGQSYGSWVRKKLRDSDEVCILGAGQLVEEILPWLNKAHKKIKIFCRRPESIRDKFASYSDIEYFHLKDMNENIGEGSLVIAAPLSAEELSPVIASQPQLKTIVDLRGESKCDPLSHDHVVSLSSVFSEMEAAKTKVDSAVQKARAFIEELSLCS